VEFLWETFRRRNFGRREIFPSLAPGFGPDFDEFTRRVRNSPLNALQWSEAKAGQFRVSCFTSLEDLLLDNGTRLMFQEQKFRSQERHYLLIRRIGETLELVFSTVAG
jgi:hypothetical protein